MAIELNDEIRSAVNSALLSGRPITVAVVTPDGAPAVTFRGSTQTYGNDALSLWIRNPDASTFMRSIAAEPRVVLTYQNMAERSFFIFHGRARLEPDEGERTTIFEGTPPPEQERDPERTGAAVIVELDAIFGRGGGEMIQMTRD
ncbi:MAG: pyridoxamine 5'-phosphate oxidase family protein [Chloroflexi bacterium]|nr:pyridoxamine 5'-phosphate oxidase family protein [Chloroflexota bacterium]